MTARVWTQAPIAYLDHYLDDREPHLFSIAVDGGEPHGHHAHVGLSPVEAEVRRFLLRHFARRARGRVLGERGSKRHRPQLRHHRARGLRLQTAARHHRREQGRRHSPRFSPDGRRLAFTQQRIPNFYADRARLMLFDRAAGTTVGVTENWDRSADGTGLGARFAQPVAPSTTLARCASIASVSRRRARARSPPAPSFSALALSRNGKGAVAIRQSFTEPPTLVRSTRHRCGDQAFDVQRCGARRPRLGQGRERHLQGREATTTSRCGWSIHPASIETKKYPVLMLLHGGPHNAIRRRAVALERPGVRELGLRRHLAQLPRLERLRQRLHRLHQSGPHHPALRRHHQGRRLADGASPSSTASAWWPRGGSYGGFLATTLLGRPHPFKALVAHAAVYNVFTQHRRGLRRREASASSTTGTSPRSSRRYSPHTSAGELQDADAGDPRPAGPARAGEPRHRAVQHAAEARRARRSCCISRTRTIGC